MSFSFVSTFDLVQMSNSALKGADGSNDDEESGLKEHIEDLYHDDVIEAIKEEKVCVQLYGRVG